MHIAMAVAAILVSTTAGAGEFECGFGNCRLDGPIVRIEWKSTGCDKPSPPFMMFASNAQEYNLAVGAFNLWISQVDAYLLCVRKEAAADMKKTPEIIVEGAKKVQQELSSEVSQQRTKLELMRPMR